MIQDELLKGCAVIGSTMYEPPTEMLFEYTMINGSDFYPIPITLDTTSRMGGLDNLYKIGVSFESLFGEDFISVTLNGKRLTHITSIHQLQILIYSITGKMPKYDLK
jgi:hypothetical protein